jgi:hypothetical protein
MFGEFPQLVDERMVDDLRRHVDGYASCVTSRGSPQPLFDKDTGEPVQVRPADAGTGEDPSATWTHNLYYPSPEMHEDAARALLEPALRLARGSARADA